jgi:hypothetical protein
VGSTVPPQRIERRIVFLRGQSVMLSPDLAELYEVEPKALMQAVKRNLDRFPEDFMFQLTWEEVGLLRSQSVILNGEPGLRSQSVTLKPGRGKHLKYLPYAFTEQGVAMLSSVLRSPRAIQVNIGIMRAFVKLRELLASHKGLARKLEELEKKYDAQFHVVFEAIRQLMEPLERPRTAIGFRPGTPA